MKPKLHPPEPHQVQRALAIARWKAPHALVFYIDMLDDAPVRARARRSITRLQKMLKQEPYFDPQVHRVSIVVPDERTAQRIRVTPLPLQLFVTSVEETVLDTDEGNRAEFDILPYPPDIYDSMDYRG